VLSGPPDGNRWLFWGVTGPNAEPAGSRLLPDQPQNSSPPELR
jgi:hypothetical protein